MKRLIKSWFQSVLASNGRRNLMARLARSRFRAFLEAEDMRSRYADIVSDEGLLSVMMSFIAARLDFIDTVLGREEVARATFVDVGDSDGIFLRGLGKHGIGLNYTEGCTAHLMELGVTAVRGDAVRLPLKDDACDYTFCFETLEHLPAPIDALKELARVSRKGVFVSVPSVSRTTVYPVGYRDAPQPLLHIFEMSDAHWRAAISHTPLRIERAEVVTILDDGRGPLEWLAMRVWRQAYGPDIYCGTLRRFQLYYLVKA